MVGVDLSSKMESEFKEWSERHLNIVQCDEGIDDSKYMHWYLRRARRFVGRPTPLASEFQRMNTTLQEVARIADTMSPQGLGNDQIQSLTRIRYIVHECLRDQARSFVTVASAPTENENCNKRGRGKEKVQTQRKGIRKCRWKDDLELCQVDAGGRDDHQLPPNCAAVGTEYIEQMDHSVDLISVNEAGDPQICLGATDQEEPSQLPDQVTQLDHENGLMERGNCSPRNFHADAHEGSEASQSLEAGAEVVHPSSHENGRDEDFSRHRPDDGSQETTQNGYIRRLLELS